MCLCSVIGLGSEGMQTHRLVPGNKGDLCGKGALEEETPALLHGPWSKIGLVESGKRDGKRERNKQKNKVS